MINGRKIVMSESMERDLEATTNSRAQAMLDKIDGMNLELLRSISCNEMMNTTLAAILTPIILGLIVDASAKRRHNPSAMVTGRKMFILMFLTVLDTELATNFLNKI